MSNPQDNYIIRSKQQMRALAAPTRQEIVDVLPRLGRVSVSELATALGRPADSLYYHLRLLKHVGLVVNAGSRTINGRPEALFRAVAPQMTLCYKLGDTGNGSDVNPIVASMLRLGIRDFCRSFRAGEASVSGPFRELWALRNTGWLSRKEIAKVNCYIQKIRTAMAGRHRRGQLYAITVLLTPLEHRERNQQARTAQ